MTDRFLNPRRFYVYTYFRDEIPCYVGKGTAGRLYQHTAPGRGNSVLHRMIAKDRAEGTKRMAKRKVAVDLTETEAFALERALIAQYGRRPVGTLVNFTDGGEGASGSVRRPDAKKPGRRTFVMTEAQKQQIRATQTGRKRGREAVEKIRAKLLGSKRTPEQRSRMSEAQRGNQNNLGQKRTAETREKLSAWQRGRKMKPEWIEKAAAARRGVPLSPEHCAAVSDSLKGVPKSPEHREATRQAMLGREIKPEWIATKKARAAAKRAARTHCRHGHDITGEGATTINANGRTICRECARAASAKAYIAARRRAAPARHPDLFTETCP